MSIDKLKKLNNDDLTFFLNSSNSYEIRNVKESLEYWKEMMEFKPSLFKFYIENLSGWEVNNLFFNKYGDKIIKTIFTELKKEIKNNK